ncbi:uncharacterized protein LOC129323677 [Eublepharis macularius]|uniref:Uncharacterized protein LOC129323677 n=1 Tax=Eublepharis macularius TaxID=481883 RepID=A0AA97IV90_EUBMA|nr:uncharacterized protein LOC129323677 [Eublepharis macularius]XP_054826226.1 uncharacterized protein LOC129323677 [Eublepharis macularius]XP_054826227.1 uncharacterized protein LOC129323677 [Eublepharis macularius]
MFWGKMISLFTGTRDGATMNTTESGTLTDPTEGTGLSAPFRAKEVSQAATQAAIEAGREMPSSGFSDQKQLPLMPPREQVFKFGPADNATVFRALFAGAVYDSESPQDVSLLPSILHQVNIAPFTMGRINDSVLDINDFVTASCICSLRLRQPEGRQQQFLQEMLTLYLPKDPTASEQEARAELQRILDDTNNLRDQVWFTDAYRSAAQAAESNQAVRDIIGYWEGSKKEWNTNVTLQQKLQFVSTMALFIPEQGRQRVLNSVLLCIISFALWGEISQVKLSRLQQNLAPIMKGISEQLTRADIILTWRNFAHLVDDSNVAEVFRRWLLFIPVPTRRLRVCLAQAADSELMSLDVIAMALHKHPTFPWYKVMRMYPQEWKNAVMALKLVGSNPIYGFRSYLPQLRSTRYKSFSYICGKLLIECGDKSWSDYCRFQEDKRYKDIIDTLIREYISAQEGPDLDEDPSGDLLPLVKNSPAKPGTVTHGRSGCDQNRPPVGSMTLNLLFLVCVLLISASREGF